MNSEEEISTEILDPASSPTSRRTKGVRRVNNVPLAIAGGTVLLFGAVIAYVAVGRASRQGGEDEEDKHLRSSKSIAEELTRGYEAGEAPAINAPQSAQASEPSFGAAPTGDTPPLPVASTGQSMDGLPPGFPAPPPPPPGLGGGAPPALGTPAQPGMTAGGGTQVDEQQLALGQMRMEMFRKALTSKTTVALDPSATASTTAPGSPEEQLAQVQAQIAALQGGGDSYMDKLAQLQASGLIPTQNGQGQSAAQKPQSNDPYGQFAGKPGEDRWNLGAQVEAPHSRYEIRAGAMIPAVLQTGINSELPGQITAIVAQDVRDTATGDFILIPQGSKLVGTYGSDVQYGQERVLVAWQRITFPDAKVLDIGAMPGADGAGYAGFKDQVNTHFWRVITSALLLSGITGGVSVSQGQFGAQNGQQTVNGVMAQSLGQQLGQVSEEMIRKQMNIAPTLEIRPGYRFNVSVTKDLVFSTPYKDFDYDTTVSTGSSVFRLQ